MQTATIEWDTTRKKAFSAALQADVKKLVEQFVQAKALDKLKADVGAAIRKAPDDTLKGKAQFQLTRYSLTAAGLRERKAACKNSGGVVVYQASVFTSSEGSVDATISTEITKNLGIDVSYNEVFTAELKKELEDKIRAVVQRKFEEQTFVATVGWLLPA